MSYNSIWMLAASAAFIANPAHGQDVLEPDSATNAAASADTSIPALSDIELRELRGGEAVVISNQTLTAITSGNVINGDYVAGNIALSDFSLSNFNGVGNLLFNTGGQVSLQTGMNLTINVGP